MSKRYIDANALMEFCSNMKDRCIDNNDIARFPAADVRENVHGHWVVKYNPNTHWYQVTCSHCGENVTSTIPLIGFFPNVRPLWDYCPECGADMRQNTEVKET